MDNPAIMKLPLFIIITSVSLLTLTNGQENTGTFTSIEGQIQSNAKSMANACVSIQSTNGKWGSGVIVSETGLIFSAAHVYSELGEDVTVFMSNGNQTSASVILFDREFDIAVLKLDSSHQVIPAKVGDVSSIENGNTLIAAGHASGYNSERRSPLRVGFGFHAEQKGLIYTTCRITVGDSGGPLYDEVGVLRAIHHSMDGKGKYSSHVPVQRFFELWPELTETVATV